MKPRHVLVLALTTGLALGCAAARAQDGGGNPPPAPQPGAPQRPAPDARGEDVQRRAAMAEEHLRAAQARLADAKARLDQLVEVEKKAADDKQVLEARARFARAEAEVATIRAHIAAGLPQGPGPGPGRDGQPRGPFGRGPGPGGPGMGPGGMGPRGAMGRLEHWDAGPGGPGPSVEQRLEMLERAVREMHAMFERHQISQEMRERAEAEMRARALGGPDTRPMPPFGPMGPMGPGGPGGPGGFGGPPGGPRPPMARPEPGGDDAQALQRATEEMKREMAAAHEQMAAAKKKLEGAHQEMEDLRRQLADTKAALTKAQEEIEALRAKK